MVSNTETLCEVDRRMTLFPTRLREFEEKNNLVFQHYLGAKQFIRRNSDTPYFGDQYRRRSSGTESSLEIYNAIRRLFRRSSSLSLSVGENVKKEVLETKLIPIILTKLGQKFCSEELITWIRAQDKNENGTVDFDGYQRICVHFLKDPEAIARAKTEEFMFTNLTDWKTSSFCESSFDDESS